MTDPFALQVSNAGVLEQATAYISLVHLRSDMKQSTFLNT